MRNAISATGVHLLAPGAESESAAVDTVAAAWPPS
jgi:hypothetical protein